jgi:hypothetical protein
VIDGEGKGWNVGRNADKNVYKIMVEVREQRWGRSGHRYICTMRMGARP